jgi:hypothetical protein
MCVSFFFARQRLGKDVATVANKHATIEELFLPRTSSYLIINTRLKSPIAPALHVKKY